MASSVAVDKLFTRAKIDVTLSGDASSAKDINWLDLRDYGGFAVVAAAAALTGLGVTAFSIVANSASDGTGDEVIIKTHAVGSAPDAAGDYLVLECTAEEIADLGRASGYALRYVSAKLTAANAADNIVVFQIRHNPRWAQDGLTADYVS